MEQRPLKLTKEVHNVARNIDARSGEATDHGNAEDEHSWFSDQQHAGLACKDREGHRRPG